MQHDYILDNAQGAAFRADAVAALQASQSQNSGATEPTTTYAYQLWADTTSGYLKQRNSANSGWNILSKLDQDAIAALQGQLYTAFTTGGTATAFTLTPAPAISANAANLRLRVKFHTAAGATPTLAVSGRPALNLKYYDATGTKQAVTSTQVPSGWTSDVENDGTDWVVLNVPPAAATATPPVPQTVLSGPVDSNGLPNFGGSTGSTTVTATGTLKATAAAGGDQNYTGSITNPSWTGLSTNGTMYLYLDITSAGVVTTGSTTLAPNYQWGGTYSTTNGQHTFNIQEMTMKMGNGASASQVTRVFVGKVTVSGGVVTAITWYALRGRYVSPPQSLTLNTQVSVNHNLGMTPLAGSYFYKCVNAEAGYSVGDVASIVCYNQTNPPVVPLVMNESAASFVAGNYISNKSTGVSVGITVTNWNGIISVQRGW